MAAESILREVEGELNCRICLDVYEEPKLLQCFHVYCKKCLSKTVDRDDEGKLFIPCPECRQPTPVPGGTAGLKPAFFINRLVGIVEKKKNPKACCSEHAGEELEGKEDLKPCCSEHVDKELRMFCDTCVTLICLQCVVMTGKHHKHNHKMVEVAFEEYKCELSSLLKGVEKQLAVVDQALADVDTRYEWITKQQVNITADLDKESGRVYLINQLLEVNAKKLNLLSAQRDRLVNSQAQLKSCLVVMKESMDVRNSQDALEMKASLLQKVKELTVPIQQEPCKVLYSGTVAVCESTDLLLCEVKLDPMSNPTTGLVQSYSSAIFRLPVAFYFNALTGIILTGTQVVQKQRKFPGSILPLENAAASSAIGMLRRLVYDHFRPPNGDPVEYLSSIGYGSEVELPEGMQEVYDSSTKRSFILNHNKSEIVSKDFRRKQHLVQVRKPANTVLCDAILTDEYNMPSELCTDEPVSGSLQPGHDPSQ